jgi:hypothetical protein
MLIMTAFNVSNIFPFIQGTRNIAWRRIQYARKSFIRQTISFCCKTETVFTNFIINFAFKMTVHTGSTFPQCKTCLACPVACKMKSRIEKLNFVQLEKFMWRGNQSLAIPTLPNQLMVST